MRSDLRQQILKELSSFLNEDVNEAFAYLRQKEEEVKQNPSLRLGMDALNNFTEASKRNPNVCGFFPLTCAALKKQMPNSTVFNTIKKTEETKLQAAQSAVQCPQGTQPVATNADGTIKCSDGSIAGSQSATPAEPTTKAFGNSFTCKDPRIVGLIQKKMKVSADCKIGPKTFTQLSSFGMVGKNLKFQDFFTSGETSQETKNYILKNQASVCKSLEEWATNPEAQAALPKMVCPGAANQPVKEGIKMNNILRQKILKEIKNILEQVNLGTETDKAGGGNIGRTAITGVGGAVATVATGGVALIPAAVATIASIVEGSPAELQDAIVRCEKDPKALADLIKAQLASRYINDNESEAMVGVARAYQTHCKGGDTSWCKKVIQNFPNYKTEIQSKWSASNIGGQKKDKLELIRLLEEFEGMPDTQPAPSPQPPEPPKPAPDDKAKVSCTRCKGVGLNCKGANVKEVQDKLVALKLLSATSSEVSSQLFGKETEAAVIKFQKSKKLKDDGIVGRDTSSALGIKCGGNPRPKKKDDDTPDPVPPPVPPPSPQPQEQGGMTRTEAIDKMYGGSLPQEPGYGNIFKAAVAYLIDEKKMSPQKAYSAVESIIGTRKTSGRNSGVPENIAKAQAEGTGLGATRVLADKIIKDLQNLTNITIGKLRSYVSTAGIQQESKQFNHENFYDYKKGSEAKILFEKLVRKL